MQLDSEEPTDYEQAVNDGRHRGRRFQLKGVKAESLNIAGQRRASPKDIPGAVEKDTTHPSVVLNSEREVLPAHWLGITEDGIYDT